MANNSSKPSVDEECIHCAPGDKPQASSKFGLYTTLAIGGVAVAFSVAALPFILPAMRKHTLPYVPATDKQIKNVFKAIRIFSQQTNQTSTMVPQPLSAGAQATQQKITLVDLGSGDGRIVFEAAKRGYHAEGIELNTMLYFYSRFKTLTNWKGDKKDQRFFIPKPVFKRADFWNISMGQYDLIVVFGVQEMMKDLASKLKAEMKEHALIVSCRYPISSYQHVYNLDSELDGVWIYQKSSLDKIIEKAPEKDQEKKATDDDDDDD